MTLPTYKEIMPELLRMANTVDSFTVQDFTAPIAKAFHLSEEEQNRWYPTGNGQVFKHRVYWAKSHLKLSGMLEPISRGVFRITPLGKTALTHSNDEIVDIVVKAMRERKLSMPETMEKPADTSNTTTNDATPEEMITDGYSELREALQNELLDKILQSSPDFFERLVVKLLVAMGYGGSIKEAGQAIGKSNDGGIDGIIKEDTLGLEVIYIQAKRWQGNVGRPEIQKFAGALLGMGAKKGVFITTSDFHQTALEYVENLDNKIILVNGQALTNYMIDYNVGVSLVNTFEIKSVDNDFFEAE